MNPPDVSPAEVAQSAPLAVTEAVSVAVPIVSRRRSMSRPTVEFMMVLLLGVLVARAFAAEAYIVPTGSMAPTLLGMHRDFLCPNCTKRFSLGMDESGRVGTPVCPNCGQTDLQEARMMDGIGDRLLVQKFAYDFRPPKRWEVAVFQNPADPSQAYVKRMVGLPNETVLIWGGDVYIDGRIARKTPLEARSMALPVYHHNFTPKDSTRYPRWIFRRGELRTPLKSGWTADGSGFVRERVADGVEKADWLEYRHWQADRGTYGPIRDFTGYNGSDIPGENRVHDLIVSADVTLETGCTAALIRVDSGTERFVVSFPADFRAPIEVRRNGKLLTTIPLAGSAGKPGKSRSLEVMVVDRRLNITIDGKPAIETFDYDDVTVRPPTFASPVAFGVNGDGKAEIKNLRIDRDVFYTDALSQTPRRPFGVEVPYILNRGEYFVLGDNSPVSNDSRFWPVSPVVLASQLLGKPFLVHLPSQAIPLKVFGREIYWVPDPREIRYIR